MKKSTLFTVLFLLIFSGLTTVTFAIESQDSEMETEFIGGDRDTLERTSREDIEDHKAELRAQKAKEIEEMRAKKTAELEKMKAEKVAEREQLREEKQAEIQERRREKLQEFAENLTEKVARYYERLTALSLKLQEKIYQVAQKGVDIENSQTKLDEADVSLELAYAKAMSLVEEIKTHEVTDQESFGEIVSKVSELKNPFREVLLMYKEVIKELKTAVANTEDAFESGEVTEVKE